MRIAFFLIVLGAFATLPSRVNVSDADLKPLVDRNVDVVVIGDAKINDLKLPDGMVFLGYGSYTYHGVLDHFDATTLTLVAHTVTGQSPNHLASISVPRAAIKRVEKTSYRYLIAH